MKPEPPEEDAQSIVAEVAAIVTSCKAEHISRVVAVEDITREVALKLQAIDTRLTKNAEAVDNITALLQGDRWHPNGLSEQVKRIEREVREILEWRTTFLASVRAFVIGVSFGSALLGGGVVALITKLFGG